MKNIINHLTILIIFYNKPYKSHSSRLTLPTGLRAATPALLTNKSTALIDENTFAVASQLPKSSAIISIPGHWLIATINRLFTCHH